jgi:hypothetical protein
MGLYGLTPLAFSILFIAAPVTYVLSLLLLPSFDHSGECRLAYGASIVGFRIFFHVLTNPHFPHLAQASLPFVVASAALSAYLCKIGMLRLSLFVMAGLTGLVLACWLPVEPAIAYFRNRDR